MRKLVRVSIGLAVIATALANDQLESMTASASEELRCYAHLECIGNTAVSGQPVEYEELVEYNFQVPIGQTLPSMWQIRAQQESRFLRFEKDCNAERYARTALPPDQQAAWNADTRDMYADLSPVCMGKSRCSQLGQPCHQNANCCTSPGPRRCDLVSGTCVVSDPYAD